MQLPYIPSDVPFTGDQKAWLSGFLAGLNTRIAMPTTGTSAAGAATPPGSVAAAASNVMTLQIAYGTQGGNAEFLADNAAEMARQHGFVPEITPLDEVDMASLGAIRRLLVITSTYGEGEMPDTAQGFWAELAGPDAPRLEGMYFGVLALGDSIYDGFCQAGKDIDARLAELGATRCADRLDCDLDYQKPAEAWLAATLPALAGVDDGAPAAEPEPTPTAEPAATPKRAKGTKPGKAKYNRKNPYRAAILGNTVLSGPASGKEVHHVVISLGDSGIEYQPGDGISIAAENDPALVALIVERLGVSADTMVTERKEQITLADALTHRFELTVPSRYLLDYIAARTRDPELTHLVEAGDKEAIDAYLWGKDVLDLLNVDPALTITPEELLAELRPLAHRVYSISSSPRAHANTVHITMAAVRYQTGERMHGGACSTFLADRCADRDGIDVFITANNSFRLPDDETKIIMIGPGTGVAPFRSFLHERRARGAIGENWLFFGDQHRESDFIYADELSAFRDDGLLTRLDLAFSRDQEHKVYVQDRMRENGAELYRWIADGASIYVCGDATRMAHDVDSALHEIIIEHGSMTPTEAEEFVAQLKSAKRYLRDVY